MEIDIDKIPLRETGMTPYEIMLSESQERMLLVATPETEQRIKALFDKWDLEAAVIGKVNDSGRVKLTSKGKVVADVPAAALADEGPRYDRPQARPAWLDDAQRLQLERLPEPDDLGAVLTRLMTSPNLCSRESIYGVYDHMVRTNTVVRPGSDAAVIRLKGSTKLLALTSDCNSRYCYLDPEEGAKLAVAEAARNLACSGAVPIGTTDCLNFGNPERPEIMWQFARTIDGIAAACKALEAPIVGGNVSFYNETEGKAIFPTPMIGMVGLIESPHGPITQWFKREGDVIYLLGDNSESSLAGSEYLAVVHGVEAGRPAPVDLKKEKALHDALRAAHAAGYIASAHDVSEGGLAVALAECCITGPGAVGARVELEGSGRADAVLFGEGPGRIVVSTAAENAARFEAMLGGADVPYRRLGEVGGPSIEVRRSGDVQCLNAVDLRRVWQTALPELLNR